MPTTNARRHAIPSGSDQSITRSTIFEVFGNSIRDVVPVANATERSQIVSDLVSAGQGPSAAKPLVVHRADAPGMHRIEYTVNGSVWLPASGTLFFSTKAAADSFATSNSGLLSVNDECRVGSDRYLWSGTAWMITDTGWTNIPLSTGWSAVSGHTPRVRMINGIVYIEGAASRGAGGALNSIGTIPDAFRQLQTGAKTIFLGASVAIRTGATAYAELYVNDVGVIRADTYSNIDSNAGWVVPVSSQYVRDQR